MPDHLCLVVIPVQVNSSTDTIPLPQSVGCPLQLAGHPTPLHPPHARPHPLSHVLPCYTSCCTVPGKSACYSEDVTAGPRSSRSVRLGSGTALFGHAAHCDSTHNIFCLTNHPYTQICGTVDHAVLTKHFSAV